MTGASRFEGVRVIESNEYQLLSQRLTSLSSSCMLIPYRVLTIDPQKRRS
jgi:hypothetical protein